MAGWLGARRHILQDLTKGEHAEGDLLVGDSGPTLIQTSKGQGSLEGGPDGCQVRVATGALVDHPGLRPAVGVQGGPA